jgi:hypothetical protein
MNYLIAKDVKKPRHVDVSDDVKTDGSAITLAAAFGRHEAPPPNQCPNWLPSWFCTPIVDLPKEKIMAKQKRPPTAPQSGKTKTKPGDSSTSKADKNKEPKTPSTVQKNTRTPRTRKPRIEPTTDIPQDSVGTTTSKLNISNARVTDNELTSASTVYPYDIDMYLYHCRFTPTGDDTSFTSIARGYFNSATGVKLLVDIQQALRKSNTITVANVADYINRVAEAYFIMQALRNHLSVCYSAPHYSSLRQRLERLYDESIPTAHMELAASLRSHFLPSGAVQLIDQLAKVYTTSAYDKSSLIQLCPSSGPVNSVANIVTLLRNATTSINNTVGTNMVDIVTAFSNDRYTGSTVSMSRVSTEVLIDNDASYLRTVHPVYSPEFLNIWGNLPYHASDSTTALITAFHANDRFTNLTKFAFSNNFDFVENALTSTYVTADSRYQPGILTPSWNVTAGANQTTLTYVDGTGSELYVNNTGYGSFAHGSMCKIATYHYNQTNQVAVRVGGTGLLYTNANEVGQDAYKLIRSLNNISTES